jgi:serpin B
MRLFVAACVVAACSTPSAPPPSLEPATNATTGASAAPSAPRPEAPATATPPAAPPPAAAPSAPPAAPPRGFAGASNRFGLDLYARLRATPGNLALSPASISIGLAMPWTGARGETATQMAKVLHLTGGDVAAEGGNVAESWSRQGEVTLRAANRLFGEKTYRFHAGFVARLKPMFDAEIEPVDFARGAEAARLHINRWVSDGTEKRIEDLLPKGAVGAETRLVLVNALYFLGDWEAPFEKSATAPAAFYLAGGAPPVDVPTMRRTGTYRFGRAAGARVVELPYKGAKLAMTILLPDERDGLARLEAALSSERLDAWVAALAPHRIALHLPKFTVEPAEALRLRDPLVALGMTHAFDRAVADFTGIADPPSPADRLYFGQVFHKTFVRVDEKGTEAAAATAVVMPRGGRPAGEPELGSVFKGEVHPVPVPVPVPVPDRRSA